MVTTKVAYLAIGVDVDGRKHALGCWIQDTEGAKFWQKVVIDLRNRGVQDILIACCDGLDGVTDAILVDLPDTVVQTCVVHVIRNAMRFVSYKDRRKVAAAMREIYTAPSVEGAEHSRTLTPVRRAVPRGDRHLAVGVERVRAVPGLSGRIAQDRLHQINAIESINFQLRKAITKNRGHFPTRTPL